MGPQVPVGGNPQKPFANRREDGCLCDGVGAKIVQLHPIDVQNRPHETTCRHSEPSLMKRDEAQHIPRWRGRGGSAQRGHPLRLRVAGERTKQTIGNKGLQIIRRDGGERPRVVRRNNGHPASHHQAEEVATERTRPRQDPFNTSPEPAARFKTQRQDARSSNGSRTTAAPRTTCPIALTLRQDRRHLWQAK
jgi:hypothetical protein